MPLVGEVKKKYQREWMAGRRAEWFEDKVCANCGSPDRLELNHKDPKQKVTHRIWSWSKERRDEELAKCEALCYDCHKAVTKQQQNSKPINHGTRSGYQRGCRKHCCAEALRQYWRDRRQSRIA